MYTLPMRAAVTATFTEIGDALRDYLAGRWETRARERTTFEILRALPAPLGGSRAPLGSVLTEIDLAKFARLAPTSGRVPVLAQRALAVLDALEAARRPPVAAEAAS